MMVLAPVAVLAMSEPSDIPGPHPCARSTELELFDGPAMSPSAEIARAMALLPVSDHARREACARRLTSVVASAAPDRDPALVRGGVIVAATYLARTALHHPEGRRLLDAIAARAETQGSLCLRNALAKAILRERALQIEIACEATPSPARKLVEDAAAHSDGMQRHISGRSRNKMAAAAGAMHRPPDYLIRQVLDALEPAASEASAKTTTALSSPPGTESDLGTSMRYTAAEVDAVFFQATEVDCEVVHNLSGWRKAPSSQHVHVADEDYYISAERPSLAARIADATAIDASAADRIVAQDHGLLALRHLAETSHLLPVNNEIFQTEIARALANIFAGTSDLAATAAKAADAGLVSLLSHWACDSRHAAGGHLQVESYRALHNLSQALSVGTANGDRRRVWVNGFLPLQPPALKAFERSEKQDTDVVFVHGLRGGPLLTWRCRPMERFFDENSLETGLKDLEAKPSPTSMLIRADAFKPANIWPRDWLAKDAPRCRISSIGHDAGVLRGGLGRGMIGPSLEERASDIRIALLKSGVGQDGRRVVFVTHSYGGLLVKQVLAEDPALWSATKGILFLGVPHFGSPVAGTLAGSSRVVLSSAVRELYPNESGSLAKLNETFRAAVARRGDEVAVLSFGEGELLELGGRHGRPTIRLDLVPANSANPRVGKFEVLEGVDHVFLPKPASKSDPVYRALIDLVSKQDSSEIAVNTALKFMELDFDGGDM
jgi:hypothetical protein